MTVESELAAIKTAAATAKTAAKAAEAAADAVLEHAYALEELLEDEGGGEPILPVISIADAEPVQAGEAATCRVTLDKAAATPILVEGTASGLEFSDWTDHATLAPGQLATDLHFPTPNTASGTFTVTISKPVNATLGRAVATGTILPPVEPGEPDLTRGLLYKLAAPTSVPIDLPAGTMLGVQTIAMVVKVPVTTGKHRKFCGCASSQSAGQGALGIGTNPQGTLDVWRAGGGQQNPITPFPPFPANQAIYLIWQQADADQELTLGDAAYSETLLTPLAVADGLCVIGAGYWAGKKVDPIGSGDEIRYWAAWNRVLTEAEIELLKAEMEPLTDSMPDPPIEPPVNPPIEPPVGNGGLEPVNPSALQVTIEVGTEPRQQWIGTGWGANSAMGGANSPAAVAFPRVKQHVRKLCEDIGATVIRLFTPENKGDFLPYYKPYWDLTREHGVDTVFTSSFIFQSNPDRTPSQVADGIKFWRDNGVPVHAASLQNEPDGTSGQSIVGGPAAYAGYLREFRSRLDAYGLTTKVLGFEWRHPTSGQWNSNGNGEVEFDAIRDLVPSVVSDGCLHIYDKGPGPNLYDDRWLKRGGALWSTETGNNGSPGAQARFIGGLNNGTCVELLHYCLIATPNPNNEQLQQAFLDWNGNPRPWWHGWSVIGTTLEPSATFRLCRSSDRPAGMPAGQAERMAILAPRQPRALVAAAKTKGGKWRIVAVNSTHGGDSSSAHAGGHYAATLQQLTVRIPDLVALDATFSVKRAGQNGSVSAGKSVAAVGGKVRFTLQPGETIGMSQQG